MSRRQCDNRNIEFLATLHKRDKLVLDVG
jgi:antitoxin (DNA-binding transcriptional repressor) of toxin-antitoxin stability system